MMIGLTVWTIRHSDRSSATEELSEGRVREQFAVCVASARAAAGEGAYHTAFQQLTEAIRLGQQLPQPTPSVRKLRIDQRQTKLLADLSAESIQEIVRHAVGLSAAEWKTVCAERYADKSVVFDVRVDPTVGGSPRIDYVAGVAGTVIEWDVSSLELWQHLPLRQPTRCVFGARLAAVGNDGGRWVVRFRPGSGVMFTDPELLGGLSFAVDDGLRDVLRRQSEWAADLPAGGD